MWHANCDNNSNTVKGKLYIYSTATVNENPDLLSVAQLQTHCERLDLLTKHAKFNYRLTIAE